MQEVSEENIIMASKLFAPDNCYELALKYGNRYKEAELTPLYFLDEEMTLIRVTTEEKMNGKYH